MERVCVYDILTIVHIVPLSQITMEMNEQNLQAVCRYLRQTLSANAAERSEGEFFLHLDLSDRSI